MKKQKFPSDQELTEVRGLLASGPAARPLPEDADAVQRLKHAICAEFVKYKNKSKIAQKDLAAELSIDEALVSKIINYSYEEFTLDRLMKFLSILYPDVDVRLLVA